jgi:hypothetical protein
MSTRDERERATYGVSLALEDGDLVLEDGQLGTVYGLQALEQDLRLRLATPLADDRLDVRYGLDARAAFTDALPRHLVKEVLRLDVVRTVSGDPRVASIEKVLFDDDAEYLAAHPGSQADPTSRTALVEITFTPAPLVPSAAEPAAMTDSRVRLLTDIRW